MMDNDDDDFSDSRGLKRKGWYIYNVFSFLWAFFLSFFFFLFFFPFFFDLSILATHAC